MTVFWENAFEAVKSNESEDSEAFEFEKYPIGEEENEDLWTLGYFIFRFVFQ